MNVKKFWFLSLCVCLLVASAGGSRRARFNGSHTQLLSNRVQHADSLPMPENREAKTESSTPRSPLVQKYADKLKLSPEKVNHLATWIFIEEWLGVRYVWGGNSKNGIDCSAFTQKLLNEVYQVKSSRMVEGQFEKCQRIDSAELRLGDLIFFKTHNKRKGLTHVAFALGGRHFVHASSSRGVVIDVLDKNYYRKTYRYSGRILPTPSNNETEIDAAPPAKKP